MLGLTEESHGNAIGLGLADFTTERFVAKIDWQATYMNGYTSGIGGLLRGRLPNVLANDRAAIATAMRMCGQPDPSRAARGAHQEHAAGRLRRSSARACWRTPTAATSEITGSAEPMQFDAAGRLL